MDDKGTCDYCDKPATSRERIGPPGHGEIERKCDNHGGDTAAVEALAERTTFDYRQWE